MTRIRETTNEPVYKRKSEKPPPLNRTGRVWRPNQLPFVVLKCGNIESSWLQFRKDGKDWQHCSDHNGALEQIVREATTTDILEWRERRWQHTGQLPMD